MKGFQPLLLFVAIGMLATNCQSNDEVELLKGELTFKLIDIGSFDALEDGLGHGFTLFMDSLLALPESTLSNNEPQLLAYYSLLKKHDLLNRKSFRIKTDTAVYKVFCDEAAFKNVNKYNSADLTEMGEKVLITMKGNVLRTAQDQLIPMIVCKEILAVEKVTGSTEW